MLAVPPFVLAAGVKVAVRVVPVPEMALKVPPVTTTSPVVPSQVKVLPGSSLNVKVMVAVSPILSVDTLLVIPNVGAVVSMVTSKPADASLTLPAVSVAVTLMLYVPSAKVVLVMAQLPPVAVASPNTVVP
ncbi:Uncharacterised protein [Comamonas aquatica]|uniref:Uncharacterized protein n=1 Tax=Comamonas aquatica TaxID=225991 RepID=A0AA35GK86_9BURK|nr:Uncharacterised protein [Comamonas aquatica]